MKDKKTIGRIAGMGIDVGRIANVWHGGKSCGAVGNVKTKK